MARKSRFFLFQPADNGVVVAHFDAVVDLTGIGLPMRRAHDIVDAHPKARIVVADSRPITGLYVAIC